MARTNNQYEGKRNELLIRLWEIFIKNGYENTTLSLIIKELGISKGAFYHYFTTKEACADAAVERKVKEWSEGLAEAIQGEEVAEQKFQKLFLASVKLAGENEKSIENINSPANAVFHQKLMAALVKELAPLYAEVIEQGNKEKVFDTEYPLETAQMLLTLTNFYFDQDLFGWPSEEMQIKMLAFKRVLVLSLNARPYVFAFLERLGE